MTTERKPAARIERSTRSTGMGARDDSMLYSMFQKKELHPHRGSSSKTGNHGSKTWYLLPGRYYEASISVSNSGKGGWQVGILTVDENLQSSFSPIEGSGEIPDWLRDLLPEPCIREIDIIPGY